MRCKLKVSGTFDVMKLEDDNSNAVKEFIKSHGYEAHILYDDTGEEAPPSLTIHQYYNHNKNLQSVMCAYPDNYVLINDKNIFVITRYDYLQLFETIGE